MPLGDIAGSIIEVLGKFIGRIFLELILELAIKGPGYIIVTTISGSKYESVDPDGWLVALAGIGFWIIVGGTAYGVYLATTSG